MGGALQHRKSKGDVGESSRYLRNSNNSIWWKECIWEHCEKEDYENKRNILTYLMNYLF